jgi:large subunit ribosomal protein L23
MAALFDRFSKKRAGPPPAKPAPEKRADADEKKEESPRAAAKAKKADEKAPKPSVVRGSAKEGLYAHLLKKPHVSEKAAILADRGVYVFDVPVTANKTEILKAVEAAYGVHVERVRTQRGIGKVMRRGKVQGQRNAWKKALVELRKGEKIALVEGV